MCKVCDNVLLNNKSKSYLRRLQEAAAAASTTQPDGHNDIDVSVSPVSVQQSHASPTQTRLSPSLPQPSSFLEPSLNPVSSITSIPIPPSRYPIAADSFHPHYSPVNSHSSPPYSSSRPSEPTSNGHPLLSSHSVTKNEESHSYTSPAESFSTYPLYNWSYKQHEVLQIPAPSVIPPLSYYYRPHRLEDIAPRDTISLIIALFFDFVYPLTPCVHKPSFMADLHSRREERDPLFFALVMSTVASTLVQVPRSYLPMERPVVRKLAQTCYEASRHISIASYDPPTSMHVVIRYL